MGALKKIYFDGKNKACKMPIFSSQNIEYIRKDFFIEKAIKYVANHFLTPGMDSEIKDFINHMEGE